MRYFPFYFPIVFGANRRGRTLETSARSRAVLCGAEGYPFPIFLKTRSSSAVDNVSSGTEVMLSTAWHERFKRRSGGYALRKRWPDERRPAVVRVRSSLASC